ncbi:MAG: glycerol acyltransferase, partial [Bacteroidota bacterium]
DKFSIRQMIRFAWSIWSKGSSITLSFGKPMDVLGNFVDAEGISYDQFEKPVDVKDYFVSDGEVLTDLQRDREYTRILTEKMVDRYAVENVVLSSHLVAYCAFQLLRHQNAELDLYGTLRLPPEDFEFGREPLLFYLEKMQEHLKEMEARGQIRLDDTIHLGPEELLEDGISNLGIYHASKPLCYTRRGKKLISQDFRLLFFYHNRLENYGFDRVLADETIQNQVAQLVEK